MKPAVAGKVKRVTTSEAPAADMRGIRPVILVMLVALVVRLAAFFLQPELTYDGTYYLRQAERLSHWHYDLVGFPPGYPLAALALRWVVRDFVLAGRLVSLLAGTLSVVLAHVLARRHLAPRLALVAALLLAVHPHAARASVETLSESLYLLLTLSAVLAYEARRDFLSAGLLGYAFLVRPEAALLLAGLALLRGLGERRPPWRLCTGFLPVAAYAVLASHTVGHPVLSPKAGQFDLSAQMGERLIAMLRTFHASFPLLVVPGAIDIAARRHRHLLVPLLYLFALPFFAIHIQERLYVPALPFLALLGLAWWAGLRQPWRVNVAVASLALFAAGSASGYRNLLRGSPLTPHAREIGLELRPQLQFDDRVAGRFPLVAYYAGAGFVRAPRAAAYATLVDSVQAAGATHLVVLESEGRNVLPQLRPLFDDARFAAADGRLRQVAWVDRPAGARAILYTLHASPIEPGNAPVVRQDADAVVWLGETLVVATRDGELEGSAGRSFPKTPEREAEPNASPDGLRLVFCQEASASRRIAVLEIATGALTSWPATAGDRPAWPTWVGDEVVYVRREEPRGLRALDIRSGRVQEVVLQGLSASEATPLFVASRGRDLAITYLPARRAAEATRIVATASWPLDATRTRVELPGKWATELRLQDDVVAWVPGEDRLVVSVSLRRDEDVPTGRSDVAALCVLRADGTLRRLSFGVDRPRRPALRPGEIAFVAGDATLRRVSLAAEALSFPPVRVFEPAPGSDGTPAR